MLPTPTAMDLTTPSERGLLMLSLLLMPMPIMVDTTVLEPTDTPDLDTDPMAMLPTPTAMELTAMLPTPTAMDLTTPSERGLLMLSLLLMPMPIMVDTTVLEPTDTPDLDTDPMELTPTAMELTAMLTTPSARGLLMLSPPLMPMPTMVDTTDMVDMLPTPTDMPAELMPTLPTPMVDTDPTTIKYSKQN